MTRGRPRGPRLEIPKSRLKAAVELLPLVIFFPILSLMLLTMEMGWRQALAGSFLLLMLWGIVGGAGEIWRRPVLTLTPSGFRVAPRDKAEIAWADVAGFRLGQRHIGYMMWFRPVLFDYRADRVPEPKGWLDILLRKVFGSPVTGWALGHGWDRSPAEVVKVLEAWRKRHAG